MKPLKCVFSTTREGRARQGQGHFGMFMSYFLTLSVTQSEFVDFIYFIYFTPYLLSQSFSHNANQPLWKY